MVLIWGWGNQFRRVADAGLMQCGNCNNISTFEIREIAKKFELYFIPVAKWGKKYYLVCNTCEGAYEIEKENVDKFLSEASNFPDNQTSLEIWNKIDEAFAELLERGDTENWGEKILPALIQQGYREEEIHYVLSVYVKSIASDFDSYEKVEFGEGSNELPASNNVFCPYCGIELPLAAKFCKKCGNKI